MNRVLSTRIDLQAGKMTTVFMQRLVLASACAMVAQISVAAERVGLTQVTPTELPNGETELRMVFTAAPPTPQAGRRSTCNAQRPQYSLPKSDHRSGA